MRGLLVAIMLLVPGVASVWAGQADDALQRLNSLVNGSDRVAAQCGAKRKCSQMNSCKEACFYYVKCGVRRLDRDKDGIPCEKICSSPCRRKG